MAKELTDLIATLMLGLGVLQAVKPDALFNDCPPPDHYSLPCERACAIIVGEFHMRCLVDGHELPAEALARREMNFTQTFPGPGSPLPYQLLVPKQVFIERVNQAYEQAVQEEKADVPCHQPGDWPLLDRLQELGFPSLNDLLVRYPRLAEELIKEWFGQDCLDRLVPGPTLGLPQYLINTINHVLVQNGDIRIEGQAFAHPMRKAE